MNDQKKSTFATSRKIAFLAFALLVVSQFFPYEIGSAGYETTISHSSGVGIVDPGSSGGAATGWEIKGHLWFYLTIMALFAYLFYKSSPSRTVYWVFLPFFLITGFGPNVGGIMGIASILIYCISIYTKTKEKALPAS